MATPGRKTVFTAEPEQVERIREVVESGRYRSGSELIREAIEEKLERVRRERLAEQVTDYCERGYADEHDGLVELQTFAREE